MTILIFHELGHFLIAKLFGWKIDKIYIYPLGGVTKFNENINKPFKEELLITIAGPIFQILLTLYLKNYFEDVFTISKILLMFNLLPIIPLDGGKLLSIFLQKIFSYYKNLSLTLIISYLFYFIVIFLIIYNFKSLFYLIVILFLIFKIDDERKLKNYYFNKFLLERSIHTFKYKKTKIVNNIYNLYKYRTNIFKINNMLYSEKEMLNKYFKIMK